MTTCTMDGILFRNMVCAGAADLRANASVVNDLNVFPIPDGDTGDNMSMTIEGGIAAAAETSSLDAFCGGLSHGMLMSARGNSGVILSQLFAGIAQGFRGKETAGPSEIGEAFRSGVRKAYGAVGTPVEGTILTVAREAAEYACSRITEESTVESFFDDYAKELRVSLGRTPMLLDVLREAGVVDSGGAGLVYVIEGMNRVLSGDGTVPQAQAANSTAAQAPSVHDFSGFTEDSVMEFGYCTEFLLRLQRAKTNIDNFDISEITSFLENVGDSIVAVKNDTIVKIHVHTMDPGSVLTFCRRFGEFLTVKIENMSLQHTDVNIEDRFNPADDKAESTIPDEFRVERADTRKKFGIAVVATGKGIVETFRSLGADVIIDGGQGSNPSTEDFIKAFDKLNANTIIVFPNNKNIRLTANQAAEMYSASDVRVLESASLGDGYAALSMLDTSSGDTDEIMRGLNEAMRGVVTGELTYAVRDAEISGIQIHRDDYIGFVGKNMITSLPDKLGAAKALADGMHPEAHDIFIIISGKDATDEQEEALRQSIQSSYPSIEIYCIDGRQEVYDFILIAE